MGLKYGEYICILDTWDTYLGLKYVVCYDLI